MFRRLRYLAALLALAILLFAPPVALAQCSMCRANAAATGSKGMRSINTGIFILMVPTISLMAVIAVVAYRRRDR
ncbi:MAG TPA: hypothetical protein VGQ81_11655 [Acidobacteriota bacterium]|nr:hypothetical protein [Acidobacteriota bacterium]